MKVDADYMRKRIAEIRSERYPHARGGDIDIIVALDDELRALRKVAEAAKRLADPSSEEPSWQDVMYALKEAGL